MPWSHNKNYSRLSPVWLHLGDRSVSWIPEKHLETFGNVWGFWITDIMVHPLLWWDSEHYAWCEVASWPDCWLVGEGGGRTLLPPLPLGEFYYDPWVRARACLGQWCYIVVSQLWLGARRGRTCRMVIIAPTTTAFLLSLHLSLVYTNTRLARDSGSNVPRDLVTGNTSPSAQSDISHLSSYLPVSTSPVFCKQSEINIPGTAGCFSPAHLMNYDRRLWSAGKPFPGPSDRDVVIWKQISVFTGRLKTWISTQGQRRAFWLKDEMDLIETFAGWFPTTVLCSELSDMFCAEVIVMFRCEQTSDQGWPPVHVVTLTVTALATPA